MTYHVSIGTTSERLGGHDPVEALRKMINHHKTKINEQVIAGESLEIHIESSVPYHESAESGRTPPSVEVLNLSARINELEKENLLLQSKIALLSPENTSKLSISPSAPCTVCICEESEVRIKEAIDQAWNEGKTQPFHDARTVNESLSSLHKREVSGDISNTDIENTSV